MSDINTNNHRDLKALLFSTIVFIGLSLGSYYLVNQIDVSLRQGAKVIDLLPLSLVIRIFINLAFSILIYLLLTSYFDAKRLAMGMTASLRANEKKYRQIFESFQDIYLETNADWTIITITPSVQKLLGFPVTKILGKKFDSLMALPDQRSKLAQALQQGPVEDFELELINSNQQYLTFSLDAQITKDINGNIKISGVLHDVTERKLQRHKEWEKNEQLRKLNVILLDREVKMSQLKEINRRLTEGKHA